MSRSFPAVSLKGLGAAFLLQACAASIPVSDPLPPGATPRSSPAAATTPPLVRWPIKTAEHVDLWLHAFAMVSDDSAPIPLYRRGYRDSLTVLKNREGILTSLDANRGALATRLSASPAYLQAQFIPLDMANWDVVRAFADRFLKFEGEKGRALEPESRARVQQFAAIFPTETDREWLQVFINGVQDEQVRFFAEEHSRLVRSRAAVITAVDSLWQRVYRPKFDRFLTNTAQKNGDILLSVPIGGEGRTGPGRDQRTVVVVSFPARVADANEVVLVFAHEITGTLVGAVVSDNTTPSQRRLGVANRLLTVGQVRAGAMLLERVAPELLSPYMRFYLAQSGAAPAAGTSGASLAATFARHFDLPVEISEALQRQIEIVLGGI
jgi:hypothetical protein